MTSLQTMNGSFLYDLIKEVSLCFLTRRSSAATAVLQDFDDIKLKLERSEHRVKVTSDYLFYICFIDD